MNIRVRTLAPWVKYFCFLTNGRPDQIVLPRPECKIHIMEQETGLIPFPWVWFTLDFVDMILVYLRNIVWTEKNREDSWDDNELIMIMRRPYVWIYFDDRAAEEKLMLTQQRRRLLRRSNTQLHTSYLSRVPWVVPVEKNSVMWRNFSTWQIVMWNNFSTNMRCEQIVQILH